MNTTITTPLRWDALDVLRGLTIILMLMNLTPGSWEFNYPFLVHAKWDGWTLIDMVAPAFLFCIGAAMPLSLERRSEKGDSRATLLRHVFMRGALLIGIGLFLNLYPRFDFATFRIPGVLQRIGLCYMLTGAFMLMTARQVGTRPHIQLPTTGHRRCGVARELLVAALLRTGAGVRCAAFRSRR